MFNKAAWNRRSAFITLYPPSEVTETFREEFSQECWDDGPHITLCYLGEVTNHEFLRIALQLQKTAKLLNPMELNITGAGCFLPKEKGIPKLALIGGRDISSWQAQIEKDMFTLEVHPPKKYGFIPHMTFSYETESLRAGWEEKVLSTDISWNEDTFYLVRGNKVKIPFQVNKSL